MAQMAQQKTQEKKVMGSDPQLSQEKYFLLFQVGCFETYEIYLLVFAVLLEIHMKINSQRNGEEGTLYP